MLEEIGGSSGASNPKRDTKYRGADRRLEPRRLVAAKAHVQLLDSLLQPLGAPFQVIVRDISERGIGMLHTEPINADFLSLRIDHESEAEYIVRLVRCVPCGVYHNIGATFVTDRELLQVALRGWRSTLERYTRLANSLDERPEL